MGTRIVGKSALKSRGNSGVFHSTWRVVVLMFMWIPVAVVGERPFACMECGRAFNQKNALETHMRKHRGERPHKCSVCLMAFTQKGNLNTHIKRAHRTELTFDAEQQSTSASESANQTLTLLTANKERSSADRTGKMADDMPFL